MTSPAPAAIGRRTIRLRIGRLVVPSVGASTSAAVDGFRDRLRAGLRDLSDLDAHEPTREDIAQLVASALGGDVERVR